MLNASTPFIINRLFNSTTSDDDVVLKLHNLSRVILVFYSLLLCVIGIPGNILATAVLRRRALGQNFLTAFLTWLAILNICCILVEMSRFIIMGLLDFNYRDTRFEICLIHRWLTLTTTTACNWLVVLITMVRWLYLRYPGRLGAVMKPCHVCLYNSLMIVVVGCFQGLLLYRRLPLGFFTAPVLHFHRYGCILHDSVSPAVASEIIICFCPIILLGIFSKFIYNAVVGRSRGFSSVMSTLHRDRRALRNKHLALLLVISNAQFAITNLPVAILCLSWQSIFNERSELEKEKAELALLVARMLMYGGYASNCIIYCFFGSRFRAELFRYLFEKNFFARCFDLEPVQSASRSVWTSGVEQSTRHVSDIGTVAGTDSHERSENLQNINTFLQSQQNLHQQISSVDPSSLFVGSSRKEP